ncbi:MAG TPA: MarR family transcriptional regulator [Abditibacteriaceae bacterium]|jgi:MarR family 2-MHQ and catechol resistance regulon transcriptional repressor
MSRPKKITSLPEPSVAESFMKRMGPELAPCSDRPVSAALFCHIYLLNSVLERMGNRCAEQYQLTMPQWMALGCIAHGGAEGVTHSALGTRLMLSKAPITGVVDRLERDGLVHRKADAHDRRVSRVVITPHGEERWETVRMALHECSMEICDCLSEDEQRDTLAVLSKLLDAAAHSDPILSSMTPIKNS